MVMDFWTTSLLLSSAAFAAGVLNAVAGGGSFLTLPALIFTGMPPIMANATSVFAGVGPWLLLLATLLFAAGPGIARRASRSPHAGADPAKWRQPGLLLVAIYGGYFNGGLGILLMALYSATGESRIHTANALKNVNSLVLSWLSVATFLAAGMIAWREGALMMAAATAGGFFGARWSKRLPAPAVRAGVIMTGLAMSALFFLRNGQA